MQKKNTNEFCFEFNYWFSISSFVLFHQQNNNQIVFVIINFLFFFLIFIDIMIYFHLNRKSSQIGHIGLWMKVLVVAAVDEFDSIVIGLNNKLIASFQIIIFIWGKFWIKTCDNLYRINSYVFMVKCPKLLPLNFIKINVVLFHLIFFH